MNDKEVRTIRLHCLFCEKEGQLEAVPTPTTHVWVPELFARWVPEPKRKEGFISLEEAIVKDARYGALVVKRNGRDESLWLCFKHSLVMRAAKILTTPLSVIKERQAKAAERKATEVFGSIASLLGTPKAPKLEALEAVGAEGDVRRAEESLKAAKASARRAKAAVRKAADPKDNGKGKKSAAKGSTKGRSQDNLQGEIDEGLSA